MGMRQTTKDKRTHRKSRAPNKMKTDRAGESKSDFKIKEEVMERSKLENIQKRCRKIVKIRDFRIYKQ